jgi:hypothetical protein
MKNFTLFFLAFSFMLTSQAQVVTGGVTSGATGGGDSVKDSTGNEKAIMIAIEYLEKDVKEFSKSCFEDKVSINAEDTIIDIKLKLSLFLAANLKSKMCDEKEYQACFAKNRSSVLSMIIINLNRPTAEKLIQSKYKISHAQTVDLIDFLNGLIEKKD